MYSEYWTNRREDKEEPLITAAKSYAPEGKGAV